MWFDPDQLVKSEQAPPAISAIFGGEAAQEPPKIARKAKIAAPRFLKTRGPQNPLSACGGSRSMTATRFRR